MSLKLVQGYKDDPDFWGIVLTDDGGYASADWDGKMEYPHPRNRDDVKEMWLYLHNDPDTMAAFIGEKKVVEDGIKGRVYWE